MEIYVFRHGIAEVGKTGQDDSTRRLTPEGKQKLRRILLVARAAGVKPDVVLSSPYKRAVETAALAREFLKLNDPVIETRALTPMERPEKVWQEIRFHKDARQLMIVGHEPLLSAVICYLIGAPGARVDFKKGAICRIDLDTMGPHPAGSLVWLLTAKLAG
jgi:phosphohistidine phosphatase